MSPAKRTWSHWAQARARFLLLGLQFSVVVLIPLSPSQNVIAAELLAGAAVIDVTPPQLPVLVNGGMLSRSLNKVKTPVNARALALSDGSTTVAIVVVDSCMMGRTFLDDAKALASLRTGIPRDRILISATHTHSAPASMGCLGTDADPAYVPFLRDKLAEAIAAAKDRLQPARIGFARADAADYTALRQWIRRPDRIAEDPFGNLTVRANMHAGANWDDAVGEAGPEDPELSLISVQTKDGRPLAVLANFSMHYFSDTDISADYFGLFCSQLKEALSPEHDFVGIMSHGCSGDIWRRDYTRPDSWDPKLTIETYAKGLADIALKAYAGIEYKSDTVVTMSESRLTLKYRVPDKQRLEWAQRIVDAMGDRGPKDTTEVYAREQLLLHAAQQTEIVLQALRIGDIGIATTPNETYAITGLKIKAASPLEQTMVIELANGGDGYIPPPEQHAFGGYNTWAARSAGLEVLAEPKIAQAAITLLEQVTQKPRRAAELSKGRASVIIESLKPVAWWRLNEFSGPIAHDSSGHQRHAVCEPGMTWSLEGPVSSEFCGPGQKNRSPHLVGGRIRTSFSSLNDHYSVSCWIWNGMPDESRDISGWFYSRDYDQGLSSHGEHLGLGGTGSQSGRLVFLSGQDVRLTGTTKIPRWTWQHVCLIREGDSVRVFLNGREEISGAVPQTPVDEWMFGGRSDGVSGWEGRMDEIAVFDRTLSTAEVESLASAASPPQN